MESRWEGNVERRETARGTAPVGIYLQPIASPWSLGALGFGIATFIIGARIAGWYGVQGSQVLLFPFALVLGGLLQLLASTWAFRARDMLATVVFGVWGSFWLAYGLQYWLFATGVVPAPVDIGLSTAYGMLFFALAAVTLSCTIAALAENIALTAMLGLLTIASILAGIAEVAASTGLLNAAGWGFVLSALAAYYFASSLLISSSFNRMLLPLGAGIVRHEEAPEDIDDGVGEPGVIRHPHADVPYRDRGRTAVGGR